MRTERDKMLAGELYDALDPALVVDRYRVRDLCQRLNASRDEEEELRRDLCRQIFGKGGDTVWMQPLFYCDYGIGDYTLFGPAVQIFDAHAPSQRGPAPKAGVWQADRHRIGCLGWRWSFDPTRCDHRIAHRYRCRECGHA